MTQSIQQSEALEVQYQSLVRPELDIDRRARRPQYQQIVQLKPDAVLAQGT
ncbi:MAG: hypothetical protein JJT85_13245 [Chromatiales bacterium]|nr:hypothetical protein [Chromatiales bacterium]